MRRRVGVVGTSRSVSMSVFYVSNEACLAPFFFCCLLENGWGNPAETSCFAKLTAGVMRKRY